MTGEQDRLQVARGIVGKAGVLALAHFNRRGELQTRSKRVPLDLVTEADGAVEALLASELAAAFPEDTFFGEETGGSLSSGIWVADPIDGTSNFVAGLPNWGISLAYVRDGVTELGLLCFPALDRCYWAVRGEGARRDGDAISVSKARSLGSARVIFGRSPDLDPSVALRFAGGFMEAGATPYSFCCCAFNLAAVAEGACDGYFEERVFPWDCLAGALIVQEAGGQATGTFSEEDFTTGLPILAAAPGVFDDLRRISDAARGVTG